MKQTEGKVRKREREMEVGRTEMGKKVGEQTDGMERGWRD